MKIISTQICDWCGRAAKPKELQSKDGTGDGLSLNPLSLGRLCAKCRTFTEGNWERWSNVQRAPIEVISLSAAEIVRAKFTPAAVAKQFVFRVDELEQLYLGVWRSSQKYVGCVQTRTGRYVNLYEEFDEFVPFTLAAASYKDEWHKQDAFKLASARAKRFWGGVSKVAKLAGVLAAGHAS